VRRIPIHVINQVLNIWDLDPKTNGDLEILFNGFFAANSIQFPYIFDNLFSFFEPKLFSHLDRRLALPIKKRMTKQDFLFNNLTIISNVYLESQLFQSAELFWEMILQMVYKWEDSRRSRVHKGSIYYFLAHAALLNNEFDKGFFCIHKAYQEDCITHNKRNPNTPADKSVRFNVWSKKNYLYGFFRNLWDSLHQSLKRYNKENQGALLRTQLSKRFIINCPSEDLVISFTHTLSKIFQLVKLGPAITKSEFAGLYELNLLFDLVLIIDNYIFSKIPGSPNRVDWGFFRLMDKLLQEGSLEKNGKCRQMNLNSVDQSQKVNFDLTVGQLINNEYHFPRKKNITPLYIDICLCYCIRNFSAHNVHLTNTIANRFAEILQRVLNVFFFCVEKI